MTFIVLGILILVILIFFTIDYRRVQRNQRPLFCIDVATYCDGGTKIYYGLGYKVIAFHKMLFLNESSNEMEYYQDIKIGTWHMDYNDFTEEIMEKENAKQQVNHKRKYIELENTKINYNLAKMVEDKCYIVMNSNVVYHIEELDSFIQNVENQIPDEIRIVQYTKEGQPILTNLEYKDNHFILKIDTRRDGYAEKKDKKITTMEYDIARYTLVKGNEPNQVTDLKTSYTLDLKDKKTNKTIPVCSYVEQKKTSNEKFEILFNKNLEGEEIVKILEKEENNRYDYNIYSYKGTVDVLIEGEKMSLREALLNNKITVEEILEKAYKDVKENNRIFGDIYLDGGSSFYLYKDYQILKCNTLSGNRNLYIGIPSMHIDDVIK